MSNINCAFTRKCCNIDDISVHEKSSVNDELFYICLMFGSILPVILAGFSLIHA